MCIAMNGFTGSVRSASHAGSWYSNKADELASQLNGWLSNVGEPARSGSRAIIAPHAGYSYSGPCAAYAYRQVNPETIKRVFILGPSHHVYLKGCALTHTSKYQTPFYDLKIDSEVNKQLESTGQFERMSRETDEDEHSIELHLPYIAHTMRSKKGSYTIVPVLVGNLSYEKEKMYGDIFSKYLAEPENLFVISSDFCHWGRRFRYHHYDESNGEIYQHVEHLDRQGMTLIEQLNSKQFHFYLEESQNSICGRHPILVLLCTIDALTKNSSLSFDFKFLKYDQSNKCRSMSDSSVSYAAGSLTVQQ